MADGVKTKTRLGGVVSNRTMNLVVSLALMTIARW